MNEVCTANEGEKLSGNPCEVAQRSRVLQFLIKGFTSDSYSKPGIKLMRLSLVCCSHLWGDKMELSITAAKEKRMVSGKRN